MVLDLLGKLLEFNTIARNWFLLLADGTMKGTLILAVIILLFKLWRRPTSQTRHLILFLAMVSMALIPLFTRGVLSPVRAQIISGLPQGVETPVQQIVHQVQPAVLIHTASTQSQVVTPQMPHWTLWLFFIWAMGVGFSGFKMLRGLIHVYHLSGTAQIVEASWLTLLNELKAKLRIRLPVRLKFSDGLQVPIVNGIMKPVILLPESMADWPTERLQAVLLHELSHIKRYDNLTQNVAHIIALFYWFNPLVWMALKLLKTNREYACDDLVLWTGMQPTAYATNLLLAIRSLKTTSPEMKMVAMFATTKVEQRMVNILEDNHNRKPLTKRKITGFVLIAFITVILSSLLSPIGLTTEGNISDEEYQKLIERFQRGFLILGLVPTSPAGEKKIEIRGAAVDWPAIWPQKGIKGSITSPFDWPNHLGVDISSPEGTPIVATGNGTVVTAGWDNTYGNCVTIQHKVLHLQYPVSVPQYPISSLYSKLQTILVHPGDLVRQGDIIGYSGNTDSNTEPHLHYEIRYKSFVVDPGAIFAFQADIIIHPRLVGSTSWFFSTDSPIYPIQTQ
jgi:beta-lactamase regulating signal transducer with metallopeptidase domain